nr:MAG TPA: hypothetical protein [Caudoviricetes sp.]DAS06095.1 MAG TPA: hypothetical protein [Caudoviricetes sp.]DAY04249.1 MAG TPA: hypothetical protein [Caudoviricetes sp.]
MDYFCKACEYMLNVSISRVVLVKARNENQGNCWNNLKLFLLQRDWKR